MKSKAIKIEVWFDRMSQTLFVFKEDKESYAFLKI